VRRRRRDQQSNEATTRGNRAGEGLPRPKNGTKPRPISVAITGGAEIARNLPRSRDRWRRLGSVEAEGKANGDRTVNGLPRGGVIKGKRCALASTELERMGDFDRLRF